MYLAALELTGFKSFAKHTRLTFEPGTTCVVGPNGSGKSAVADAIRWVLGEQSLKSIRAKRSEDVIFAGSRSRPRLGMAEVSLTLADASTAGLDTPELVVTRRIDRSGASAYLVNDRPIRLFDLAELLARAGFAQKSYTVIPQGMIDAFVTASPQERRQMFEDATGVTPLLLKQARTERKLAETNQQVVRARDLLRELEPRLRALNRQAARARGRSEVEAALRKTEEQYTIHRWQAFTADLEATGVAHETAEHELKATQARLEHLERPAAATADVGRLPELRQAIEDLREQEREMLISVTRAEVTGGEEVDRIGEELTARTKEREKLTHDLQDVEAGIRAAGERQGTRRRDLSTLQQRFQAAEVSGTPTAEGTRVALLLVDLRERVEELRRRLDTAQSADDLVALRVSAAELHSVVDAVENEVHRTSDPDRWGVALQGSARQLAEVLQEYTVAAEHLRERQVREASLRERIRAVEERLETLKRQRSMLLTARSAADQLPTLQSQLLEVRETLKSRAVELQRVEEVLLRAHAEKTKIHDEGRRLQERIRAAEEKRTTAAVHAAEITARRDELRLEAGQHLGSDFVGRLERGALEEGEPVADQATLRSEIERLRRRLLDTGGSDATVLEEEAAVEKRVTELRTQVEDLDAAEKSLRSAMTELERHIHDHFTSSFQAMNELFNRYFREVFGGGRASLSLVKPRPVEHALPDVTGEDVEEERADLAEERGPHVHELPAGVEIHALPPGKKVSALAQLSGGEKALTSIALLCAILKHRASPFVVLDEVDAALDEANSRRFARLLQAMAERTQLIVITHNRATMEAARVLYGVTMGDDGVSQLLSVKLEEVTRYGSSAPDAATRVS